MGGAWRRVVVGWCEDFGVVVSEPHRVRLQRAAQLVGHRRAGGPIGAVVVGGGEGTEFVAREFEGGSVVRRDLGGGGVPGERAGLEERGWGGGAVQVAVADGGAGIGAVGTPVVGVEVLDEAGAEAAQWGGPVLGDAVGVARV